MKESMLEIPRASMPTWETLEGWVRGWIQDLLQRILEEEVTEALGRTRYARRSAVDAPGSRNGYGKPRRLALMSGTIEVRRPRIRGLEERFESRILPLFQRRTQEVTRLLPELYLHGLSQGDFELALRGLLGDGAPLSPSSIARLRATWEEQFETWQQRRLDDRELVYAWADGIYVKAGLEKDKAALLVVIGALSDGRKEILAIRPGHRESTESWRAVLRDLRDRGLPAPRLMLADGGLPIWSAVDQVWPEAAQQRCWNHKILNVLNDLPKRVQGAARALLTQIPTAKTRQQDRDDRSLRGSLRRGLSGRGGHPRARLGSHGHVLRFPGGALETSANDEPGGEPLCLGPSANQRGQTLQAGPGGHRSHLAPAEGGRDTISQAQRARAPAGGLRRSEIPGRKTDPRGRLYQGREQEGRLISFTHLLTRPPWSCPDTVWLCDRSP